LHDELALYVERGLTPAQALSAATRAGPAWFDKLDRYGSPVKGKAADWCCSIEITGGHSRDALDPRGDPARQALRWAALDKMLAETKARVAAWNAQQ
jgi:hypothetical protein